MLGTYTAGVDGVASGAGRARITLRRKRSKSVGSMVSCRVSMKQSKNGCVAARSVISCKVSCTMYPQIGRGTSKIRTELDAHRARTDLKYEVNEVKKLHYARATC